MEVVAEEEMGILFHDDFPKRMSWKQARELSVKKWETIAEFIKKEKLIVGDVDAASCALCENAGISLNDCDFCPVYKKTGRDMCCGTPFIKYMDAGDVPAALKAARAEVKFLKKLEVG